MDLNHLLDKLHITDSINQKENINIKQLAYDSRKVKDGCLFVCLVGENTDGHNFIQDAINRGALAIIVEKIDPHIQIPQYKVDDSRFALSILAKFFYEEPTKDLQMIGVTATNGKTTTTYMINEILEAAHTNTGLIGSVSIKINGQNEPAELTTPEALELQSYFRQMVNKQTTHAIMEVSSAAQEMQRVASIPFDIVSLNNIGKEHIDTHGSFERYVAQKTRLITEANKNAYAILNLDCKEADELQKETKAQVITFAVDRKDTQFTVENLDLSTGRAKFTVHLHEDIHFKTHTLKATQFDIELGIPGLHSVSNSMIAIIVALINNIEITTIQKSLKDFTGVHRRFQFIHEGEFTIIDDHFANPNNINVTLETLSLMDYKDLKLLYAIRGNRGAEVNRDNAETLVKWAQKLNLSEVYVTRSQSDVTEHDLVTDEEYEAFVNVLHNHKIKTVNFDELDDAIQHVLHLIKKDDLLLLAGCQGMDEAAKYVKKYI